MNGFVAAPVAATTETLGAAAWKTELGPGLMGALGKSGTALKKSAGRPECPGPSSNRSTLFRLPVRKVAVFFH